MTQLIDTLLYPRWIIPVEPENVSLENHAIAVHDERIIDVLSAQDAEKKYSARNTVHLAHHVVMPGLVNMHTHSAMVLFRGMADDLALMEWLQNHIWPAEKQWLSAQFVYDGTQLAILEMLRSGTTCFNDNYFFPDGVAHAAVQAGMRAAIGAVVINFSSAYAADTQEYIAKALESYDAWRDHKLITHMLAPHAPYTVDDKTFIKVAALAAENKLRIHLHLHETKQEITDSLRDYGKRPLKRLQDLGLVSPDLLCVHMTQVDAEDIAILENHQAHVIHCPESNLKLASGFCPVAQLMKNNINVALGTDGAASNNDLNMFIEMRTAALLAKAVAQEPTALNAMQAIKMATLNGAQALGLADNIGSITPGKYADLIAVNLTDINTQPLYNPISHVVYALNAQQVSDVWVAGKRLLENGAFTQSDAQAIVARAHEWAQKLRL